MQNKSRRNNLKKHDRFGYLMFLVFVVLGLIWGILVSTVNG